LLLKPAKLTQVADRVINENIQLLFVVIFVVFDIPFFHPPLKNCSSCNVNITVSSQMFPLESSSQFSTQTAHWDLKYILHKLSAILGSHMNVCLNHVINLQFFLQMKKI